MVDELANGVVGEGASELGRFGGDAYGKRYEIKAISGKVFSQLRELMILNKAWWDIKLGNLKKPRLALMRPSAAVLTAGECHSVGWPDKMQPFLR